MTMVEAVAEAYEAHVSELQRFTTAKVRDARAAEDIVQEAYLRLAMEAQADRFPDNPRAWLYRVAANITISQGRRATTAARHASREAEPILVEATPESHYLAAERSRIIRMAMQEAGPDGRKGMMMAAEGYSGREIARALGRSENATRIMLHRARARVRRELEGEIARGSGLDVASGRAMAA